MNTIVSGYTIGIFFLNSSFQNDFGTIKKSVKAIKKKSYLLLFYYLCLTGLHLNVCISSDILVVSTCT